MQQAEETFAEYADVYAAGVIDLESHFEEEREQAKQLAMCRRSKVKVCSWVSVAGEPVSRTLDLLQQAEAERKKQQHTPFTVRQAAACIVHTITTTSCTFEAAVKIINSVGYGLLPRVPSPDNAENRFTPSLYVCYQVLQVPSVSEYEVHLCPSGCLFRF
jgi:hypothetical protein